MWLIRVSIILSLICSIGSKLAFSQSETTSFGLGYNIIEKKPSFDFQFNRKTAAEAEDAFEIKLVKKAFVLNPSAETHLGSGNETSENNILINLNTYLKKNLPKKNGAKWTSLLKGDIASPHLSADKNFSVYQLFATLGGDFVSYYSRRDLIGYIELGLGINCDLGRSSIDSTNLAKQVSRIKFTPSFQWHFAGKVSNEAKYKGTPELDPDFIYRAKLSLTYSHNYFMQQDERIVNDKSFGFLKAAIDYRVGPKLKLVAEYKVGMVEPLYKKLNALTFGVALIN
jgi:hypothetical protein